MSSLNPSYTVSYSTSTSTNSYYPTSVSMYVDGVQIIFPPFKMKLYENIYSYTNSSGMYIQGGTRKIEWSENDDYYVERETIGGMTVRETITAKIRRDVNGCTKP